MPKRKVNRVQRAAAHNAIELLVDELGRHVEDLRERSKRAQFEAAVTRLPVEPPSYRRCDVTFHYSGEIGIKWRDRNVSHSYRVKATKADRRAADRLDREISALVRKRARLIELAKGGVRLVLANDAKAHALALELAERISTAVDKGKHRPQPENVPEWAQ